MFQLYITGNFIYYVQLALSKLLFFTIFFLLFLEFWETAFTGAKPESHNSFYNTSLLILYLPHSTVHTTAAHHFPPRLLTTTLLEFYYIHIHTHSEATKKKKKRPVFDTGGIHDLTHGRYHEREKN